jgi:hypothetical protein
MSTPSKLKVFINLMRESKKAFCFASLAAMSLKVVAVGCPGSLKVQPPMATQISRSGWINFIEDIRSISEAVVESPGLTSKVTGSIVANAKL